MSNLATARMTAGAGGKEVVVFLVEPHGSFVRGTQVPEPVKVTY